MFCIVLSLELPAAPRKPTVSKITNTEVTLEWEAPSATKEAPVDGFNVYLREKGTEEWRKVTKDLTKEKIFILGSLESGLEYEAKITAENEAGESEPSPASDAFRVKVEGGTSRLMVRAFVAEKIQIGADVL